MKKIILKILATFILTLLPLSTALAVDFSDIKAAESQTTDCIQIYNRDGTTGPDNGKIIEFIEEPFANPDTYEGYEIRTCYRNIIQFKIGDMTREHVGVYTECAQSFQDLAGEDIKFTCKEIQAIVSTGGTNFLFGYIGTIYRFAAGLVGIVAVTVIILSGIQITASGGDSDAISQSKTRIIQSIAGLALLFLSGLILNAVNPNFFT